MIVVKRKDESRKCNQVIVLNKCIR